MSRKKCKRKVYQLVDPIQTAIKGACITETHLIDQIKLKELVAIESMQKGQATLEDWRSLVDMVNLCEMFIKRGVGQEALNDCNAAHESLRLAAIRFKKTGKMGLDGTGLKAIKEVYEWHSLQRTSVNRSMYEQIIKDVENHIKSKSKEVVMI